MTIETLASPKTLAVPPGRKQMSTQPLVLVADDEPRITKLVAIALSEEGFRVVTANGGEQEDRKSTRLNSSHANISYAVFCLKKKKILHPSHDHTFTLVL